MPTGLAKGSQSPEVWKTTFTIDASLVADSTVQGSVTRVAGQPSNVTLIVPSNEFWEIDDFQVAGTPAVDGQIQPVINNDSQGFQPLLSMLDNTLNQPTHLPVPIQLPSGFQFNLNLITLVANSLTIAQTDYVYIKVVRTGI